MWQLLPAIQIARALEPYDTFWHEDPIRMDSLSSLNRYADASKAPISASETLATRWGFRDPFGNRGWWYCDARYQLVWWPLRGPQKSRQWPKLGHLPVAPHDCTGPVVLAASTHLSLNATKRAGAGKRAGRFTRLGTAISSRPCQRSKTG